MNLAVKSMILGAGGATLITLIGGGNFYSFLFFFVILFLPAILIFVSFDIVSNSSKDLPANDTTKKKEIE